ncbi:hypothetical protein CDCA_CDCA03G1135 [Cyanidium caldarium]|uniref:Galactose-1-phosphate uridylyltransferase n=1 Tax=Cyanidium caldarium TaxID=2771 RepID=A0AAV9ISM8_CYACA|nr:hypothetical protein CDCA_CDCA03G1135 [Cyanidium caldarium]
MSSTTPVPFDFTEHPHRRYNPLIGEWLLCSPHRAKRPWQGAQEKPQVEHRPAHDPDCYLCAGNTRVGGERNPKYDSTYVFTNDFQAMMPDTPSGRVSAAPGDASTATPASDLFVAEGVQGTCRVVCFSPRHDLTLAEMRNEDIRLVVDTWQQQYRELGALPYIAHVQIFENKGQAMGCSNPHPHGQIWASSFVPQEVDTELRNLRAYYERHQRHLLRDYVEQELRKPEERIVCRNQHFVALVPFWAVWPFEVMVLPAAHLRSLLDFSDEHKDCLADILRRVAVRYDNLFQTSFPYSMGMHQAPTCGAPDDHPEAHFHMHFYPPLLRSATVRKFMVGFEMLGESQRDLTAEQAAARLRELSDTVHYTSRL